MIVICEGTPAEKFSKPVICPKCQRGRVGSVPKWSKTGISRRGRPPPHEMADCLFVRCPICGSYVSLTIE